MEVVPTGDGDDDGVVWFRCPQCQGFLPMLSAASAKPGESGAAVDETSETAGESVDDSAADAVDDAVDDTVADEFDAVDPDLVDIADTIDDADDDTEVATPRPVGVHSPVTEAEPIREYVAMLAAVDPEASVPYRPWDSYEVGQCVLHLAWNDCGVVVAKEVLPGGRHVIKCWFQGAGVVRLIENTPR